MLSVCRCLEIFVSPLAHGHHYPDRVAVDRNVELPAPILNSGDCLLLRQFPSGTALVHSTDAENPLMGIGAVALVDALNLNLLCHSHYLSASPTGRYALPV